MSVDKTLVCDQMKAIEQYFDVGLCIMLYKVVLTLKRNCESAKIVNYDRKMCRVL